MAARALPVLLLFVLTGCGHSGPRTVSRRWLDCNHYGMPAYVKDRIDVRPHKSHRVATYRWAHVRGPYGPLGSTQPVVLPCNVDPTGTVDSPETPVAGRPTPEADAPPTAPSPQLFPEGRVASRALHDAPPPPAREARLGPAVDRTPVRTSWMFRSVD